jgi:hypothetical protein
LLHAYSILGDDLAQWRAYSGGKGGYAIRFDPQGLAKSGLSNEILLHRLEYDARKQATLLDDILTRAERYYIECEGRGRAPNLEEWAQEFLELYLVLVQI